MKWTLLISTFLLTISCSDEVLVRDSFQKSVVVQLKNGAIYDGIVADIKGNDLIFINGKDQKGIKFAVADVVKMIASDRFYDGSGVEITEEKYKKYKGSGKTILYSGAGTLLGGLVGGLLVGLATSPDLSGKTEAEKENLQTEYQNNVISGVVIFAAAGGVWGGIVGYEQDVKDAVEQFKLRRAALQKILDDRKKQGTQKKQ